MKILLSAMLSVVLLLLAGMLFFSAQQLDNPQHIIQDYQAKRDDLVLAQQRIESQIRDLRKAIEEESAVQDTLTGQIVELSKKADLPPPVINKTTVVQEPQQTVVIPRPKPQPVTRAS
ncbi:hypothetical protein H6504_05685 [Candidatus Woesearchaeota archaeon]|nr:hypothetical protein [Candidatus Woesearchaeota archaeon]